MSPELSEFLLNFLQNFKEQYFWIGVQARKLFNQFKGHILKIDRFSLHGLHYKNMIIIYVPEDRGDPYSSDDYF